MPASSFHITVRPQTSATRPLILALESVAADAKKLTAALDTIGSIEIQTAQDGTLHYLATNATAVELVILEPNCKSLPNLLAQIRVFDPAVAILVRETRESQAPFSPDNGVLFCGHDLDAEPERLAGLVWSLIAHTRARRARCVIPQLSAIRRQ